MTLAFTLRAGPADRLHQRRFAAQKAFLVGIEDGDHRDFGQVEPFAEQIHADQGIEFALPQVAQQLNALEGVEFAVQPFAHHAFIGEVRGRSSARRLVSVVTSTRSPTALRSRTCVSRCGTWPRAETISITGSSSPVGRITCSTTSPPVCSSSNVPGVAET